MKLPFFGCVAFAYATTAFAQTGAPTSTSPTSANQANQTITLSGCVGPGATANDPLMLSNVTIVSAGPTAASAGAGATGAAGTASATGAAGTAGTAGATGTTGMAGTPPPVGTGATGTTATGSQQTAAPSAASQTAGQVAGYRLSGADVQPFSGQRVQVVGMFAPSRAGSTGASGSAANAMPEFRVISIQPIGPCQQQ